MNTTDRTNIADRSRAALMGHETRRKRQAVEDAIIEDLAVRHKGAAKIKVWWKTFVLLNPEAAKPWKGAMPMGHDGGPPTPIVRGAKAANDLPVPADVLPEAEVLARVVRGCQFRSKAVAAAAPRLVVERAHRAYSCSTSRVMVKTS